MGRESRGRNKRDKRNEQRDIHAYIHRKQRSGEEEREKGVENTRGRRTRSIPLVLSGSFAESSLHMHGRG